MRDTINYSAPNQRGMRIPNLCPICKRRGMRPDIKSARQEGDQIIISAYYGTCGHTFFQPRPYKTAETLDGYIVVQATQRGSNGKTFVSYVPEHRFIWEQHHGTLSKGMVVHHINGIKNDNRIENLIALPRIAHNNHMQGDLSIKINCPFCHKEISVIKTGKARYATF